MRLNQVTKIVPLALITVMFYGCPSEELTSARLYVKEENWEKAEEMIAAAIEVTPEDPEPYYLMGKEVHARNKEWSKMNEMFDKAIELGPAYKLPDGQLIPVAVETWTTFYWSREYNAGADAFNQAIGATEAEEKKTKFSEAIDGFTTAKAIRPGEPGSYKNLVFCYIQINDQEMLESTLDEALKVNPDDPDMLFTAGKVFKDNGDFDTAVEYLERGLKINSSSSIGARYLADAYYEMGDKEGAVFAYTKAIRSDPENADLHFNLGVLYLQLEDFEMTEEEFQKVLRLNPDDNQAAIGMGEAYEGMKRWEDAEYYYSRALRSDSENTLLLRAMGRVIYLQGRMDEGNEYLQKAKEIEGR
tara:strand:- start:11742 stop:12818 length:1077 start_codon:yes stop_codon:yes gene_type:complete